MARKQNSRILTYKAVLRSMPVGIEIKREELIKRLQRLGYKFTRLTLAARVLYLKQKELIEIRKYWSFDVRYYRKYKMSGWKL